jgi:glycosyltransferase involved in cell wall biosynthesis
MSQGQPGRQNTVVRIAVLGPSHQRVSEPFAGGVERFTADVVRGLRQRGHHLELYALEGSDSGLAQRLHAMPELPALSDIATADPAMPDPLFLHDQFVYLSIMRDLLQRNDIDVVLNESLHQLPLAISPALSMPMVTTLHTPPLAWLEIGAWLAGASGHFVAVSESVRQQWAATVGSTVIYNGVDASRFPVGAGGEALAWVGRLLPDKGADIAIAAAAQAGRDLRLAGPMSDPEWFDRAIRPKLSSSVTYLGALSGRDVAELYGSCAVTLVTPRWPEPFCLVAVESQMCGTPVVGIRRGGLAEVVSGAGGRLVPEGASLVHDLAAAVDDAVRSDRETVADRARVDWDWNVMVDRYEELCLRLCRTGRRTARTE